MPVIADNMVKLVVGLGNPGAKYAHTRHNAGFDSVTQFMGSLPAGRFEESFTAESRLFTGKFRGRVLLCQLPCTFMNASGKAVGTLSRRLEIEPQEILVVSDDLDLPLGKLRLRNSGSDGGHNGLKSIIAELGSEKFMRLRIGIGRPEGANTVDYVLEKFSGANEEIFSKVLAGAAEAIQMVLTAGMARAMNHFNNWSAADVITAENSNNSQ